MKIVGSNTDYYDGGRIYGIDPRVRFVRNNHATATLQPLAVKLTHTIDYIKGINKRKVRYYNIDVGFTIPFITPIYVIFCGHLYRGAVAQLDKHPAEFFWDHQSFSQYLINHDLQLESSKNTIFHTEVCLFKESSEQWFGVQVNTAQQLTDKLIADQVVVAIYNSPMLINGHSSYSYLTKGQDWKINTNGLKSIDFAKAVDPIAAFQEIEMWIAGPLANPDSKMVAITDEKVMVAKHGMDKTSFRTVKEPL